MPSTRRRNSKKRYGAGVGMSATSRRNTKKNNAPQVPTLTANRAVTRRGGLVERAGRRYCCGMVMARLLAMEEAEQYRGTLRKPNIGISWRDAGEGLICLCPSHHLKAERREKKSRERREIKKKEEKDDFFFPPNFYQGATRLMSRGNIEHSFTFAMPRKQAVMRSRPMAKPP